MTWTEFSAARQLLAEEWVGAPVRDAQRQEDEIAHQSAQAIRETRGY